MRLNKIPSPFRDIEDHKVDFSVLIKGIFFVVDFLRIPLEAVGAT